jgi:hypothetical protein
MINLSFKTYYLFIRFFQLYFFIFFNVCISLGQSKSIDTISLNGLTISISKSKVISGDSIIIKAELTNPSDKDVILTFNNFGEAIENIDYKTYFKNKGQRTLLGWSALAPGLSRDVNGKRILVDKNRSLYVSETDHVLKVEYGDTLASIIGGGNLVDTYDLLIDKNENIYVSDRYLNSVLKFAPGQQNPQVVAGGNGGSNLSNQLWYPWGIALDDSLNLFIADYFNHRIQKWAPGAISGTTILEGEISGTRDKIIPYPKIIYVDKKGFLYILDAKSFKKWKPGSLQPQIIFEDKKPGYIFSRDFFIKDNGDILYSNGALYILDSLGKSKGVVEGFDGKPLNIREVFQVELDFLGNQYILDSYNARVIINQTSPEIVIPAGQKTGDFKINIIGNNSSNSSRSFAIKPVFAKNFSFDTSLISPFTVQINCTTEAPVVSDISVCNGDTSAKFSISTGINNRVKWYLESGDSTQAPLARDLISGKYRFLISQIDPFGCESKKKEMLVDVIKRPNPPTADSVEFCYNGQSKPLSAIPSTNSILNWYGTNAIGGTKSSSPPIPSTLKEGVFNYYVSQLDSLSKCESDRSVVKVSINPIPSRPTIVRSNSMLLSSAPLGNQWLKNGEFVAGATDTSYKPIENGQYSLQVTLKNCTSPNAESYYFITTGLSNLDRIGQIKISPNPVKTQLFIESRETQLTAVTLEIYDLKGSLLMRKPRFKLNTSLDVGHLNNGVYLFVIKSNDSQIIYQTQLIKSQ